MVYPFVFLFSTTEYEDKILLTVNWMKSDSTNSVAPNTK